MTESCKVPEGGRISSMLIIVATFFPEGYGGAERQALILAHALARKGVNVTIAAPAVTSLGARQEATPFGQIVRFPVRHYPNYGGRRIGSTLSWIRQLRSWALPRQDSFDVVYVFHARLHALAGSVVSALTGKPMFIKLGGGGEASEFAALGAKKLGYAKLARRLLLRQTRGFVANSAIIADDLRGFGVEEARIFSFPNGVELPQRSVLEPAVANRNGARMIFTGRLVPDKRVDVLIRALAVRRQAGAALTLTLIGDGPQEFELRQLCQSLGVSEAVRFLGRCDDVAPLLLNQDLFVSASMREGQSNSLLEAMATGCIPVVCPASGVEDVVGPGRGFISDGPSPEEFARALQQAEAMTGEERRSAALAIHDHVERTLGIDAIAERTLASFGAAMALGAAGA
jgi:glycosyltransferase involved in cell wall biosynthesis